MTAYDTKLEIASEYLKRTPYSPDIQLALDYTRDVLNSLSLWIEKKDRPGDHGSVTAKTLREIANAKPDPLDSLSTEDRLGYAFLAIKHTHAYAREAYFMGEHSLLSDEYRLQMQRQANKEAAAFIAEYERLRGAIQ